ncbi:hypothetical protein V2W45_1309885 [Cenococcum geophilum]
MESFRVYGWVPGSIMCAPDEDHSLEIPEQSHSSGKGSSNVRGQPGRNVRKGMWSGDDDNEHMDEGEDTQCDVRSPAPPLQRARFACPFYKRNSQNPQNARSCTGPGWPETAKVKEHLYRTHVRHECPRCFQVFPKDDALREHQRATEACPRREQCINDWYDWDQGFNEDQKKKLKSRKGRKDMPEEEKWKDIYRILFPSDPESDIPSPCKCRINLSGL